MIVPRARGLHAGRRLSWRDSQHGLRNRLHQPAGRRYAAGGRLRRMRAQRPMQARGDACACSWQQGRCAWHALLALAGSAAVVRRQVAARPVRGNWVTTWGTAQQLAVPARAIPARDTPPAKVQHRPCAWWPAPPWPAGPCASRCPTPSATAPVRIDAVQLAQPAGGSAPCRPAAVAR